MSDKKTKLELTWIGKENRPRLEPRILLAEAELSYSAQRRVSDNDLFDNLLIHGDNLLALKALQDRYAGRVKAVYIDPPYNTGSAFEHYDDAVEHSVWLSLLRERLELLRALLRDDGLMFVQIDDRECAYLQVLLDEIFGRPQRINVVAVKMSELSGVKMAHVGQRLPKLKEFILIYGKSPAACLKPLRVTKSPETLDKYLKYYGNYIVNPEDAPEKWQIVGIKDYLQKSGETCNEASIRQFKLDHAAHVVYRTNNKSFEGLNFPTATARVTSATGLEYIWWEGKQMLFLSDYIEEYMGDLWTDISTINLNKEGGVAFPNGKKPEALVRRVLKLSTEPGDIVVDSFVGSGTTAAVAHKMRRRWIAVELGNHAITHCLPRLKAVVDGTDEGGVSEEENFKGGGGFRFYRLAPSLLARDRWGNYVISETYRKGPDAGARLAEAMCKLEGFTYAPSASTFWMHGTSTERDFIYVTTQTLTHDQLAAISDEVGQDRTLLICCGAFVGKPEKLPNLTVKKIPAAVLTRCEWGKDDYSLNVAAVTGQEPPDFDLPLAPGGQPSPRRKKKPVSVQELSLFNAPRGDK
jgi:adenine-specific DNA-methyltransferase